ncbi:hypothetical protein BDZ94DRAFT_1312706 [Collybia nuda]|uniref:Uncharacterized protein n=1 Tax=Collybia nuda TaxID=64659 RepID=A0A9P5Y0N0_9AGAR|nr:hypothetical protein BDZ94DRAFT_1312706 [Collybia nuda]
MLLSKSIPFDIVNTIVQQLHDDPVALRTASLVSHSFLIPSQRCLFSKIDLWVNYSRGGGYAKLRQLLCLFTERPDLPLHVRHFHLSTSGEAEPPFTESVCAIDSCIQSLLLLLQNVRSFTLYTSWDRLTITCQNAILQLCNSPQLNHIDAQRLHAFPMACFSKISRVSRFTLRGTRISYLPKGEHKTTVMEQDILPRMKYCLDILEFDENSFNTQTPDRFSNTFTQPSSFLDISHLWLLKLNGNSIELMEEAWNIIQVAAATLKYFIWDLLSYRLGPPDNEFHHTKPFGTIDISRMSNLHFLAFAIGVAQANNTWILNSLASIAGRNRLETLMIAIYHHPCRTDSLNIRDFLTPLDRQLASGNFPNLITVIIYLGVPDEETFSTKDTRITRDFIIDGMPLLRKTEILRVENIDALRRDSGPFCVDHILAMPSTWKRDVV